MQNHQYSLSLIFAGSAAALATGPALVVAEVSIRCLRIHVMRTGLQSSIARVESAESMRLSGIPGTSFRGGPSG